MHLDIAGTAYSEADLGDDAARTDRRAGRARSSSSCGDALGDARSRRAHSSSSSASASSPGPFCRSRVARRCREARHRRRPPRHDAHARRHDARAATPPSAATRSAFRCRRAPIRFRAATRHAARARRRPRADTIKAPLTRAPSAGRSSRSERLASTIAQRCSRPARSRSPICSAACPGSPSSRTGWLGAPAVGRVAGRPAARSRCSSTESSSTRSIRATRGVAGPPTTCRSATLEELRIERGADEVRVYVRTLARRSHDAVHAHRRRDGRPEHEPLSRLFRPAVRARRGGAARRASNTARNRSARCRRRTRSTSCSASGTTRGPWSVDLFTQRSGRNRAQWVGFGNSIQTIDTIPGAETVRSTSYARIGNGDPERGPWIQLMAASRLPSLAAQVERVHRELAGIGLELGARLHDRTSASTCCRQARSTGRSARARPGGFAPSRAGTRRVRRPALRRKRRTLSASVFAEASSPVNPSRIDATARLTRCASARVAR